MWTFQPGTFTGWASEGVKAAVGTGRGFDVVAILTPVVAVSETDRAGFSVPDAFSQRAEEL